MSDSTESNETKPPEKPITAAPSITVSFPLGLFGSASMNVPCQPKPEPPTRLPDRTLLDMPNTIPDMEGNDEYFYLDDV